LLWGELNKDVTTNENYLCLLYSKKYLSFAKLLNGVNSSMQF